MSRPLLITDCDEVLLHMVRHFRDWLAKTHAIDFDLSVGEFERAMRRRDDGALVARDEMWALVGGFFPAEMARQTLVPGVSAALAAIAEAADIVILTNLGEQCRVPRIEQLARHGIHHCVVCNQGPKGAPVAALVDAYRPSVAVFVDDLAAHHASVAAAAPAVFRLHLIAEPTLAAAVPPAPAAHARIDIWPEAAAWIADRFAAGVSADGTARIPEGEIA